MSKQRQDFLLQPYTYPGSDQVVWDFPLDDFYINGVIQPTPYGDSDEQHKLDIIINSIGAIKQFPLLGFGLIQYQNGETQTNVLFDSLSENMESDKYFVGVGAIKNIQNKGIEIDTTLIIPTY